MRYAKKKLLALKSKLSLIAAAVVCFNLSSAPTASAQTSDLVSKTAFRVCADPANSPMSNKDGSGFENKIAEFIASKLELPVEYTWYPMSTGFIRNTLRINKCDVVIGYAQGHELVANTNHYLTSVYTLVVPKDGPLADVTSFSDKRLKGLRIGVIAGSPPANHMTLNGLISKAKGYNLVVDSRYESPPIEMLEDLRNGKIAAASLWGPIAGPLVKQKYPEFKVIPLTQETTPPRLYFRITMGARRGERVWVRKLNSLLRRNKAEINKILADAGVPLMNDLGTAPLGQTN